MTLPAKTDFLNVGFTERQADALVDLIRRQRRARFLYPELLGYAVYCSLLVVFLFSLHSCYQLDRIHRHVQTNQTLVRAERSNTTESLRAINRRLTGIETELMVRHSPRP